MLGEPLPLAAPQPARLFAMRLVPPPRPLSAAKHGRRSDEKEPYIGSLHALVPRRPHSACATDRPSKAFVSTFSPSPETIAVPQEVVKNTAIVVKAPQAIRGFPPVMPTATSLASPSPSPSHLVHQGQQHFIPHQHINVDKPLPAVKHRSMVSGMPTPPQTPETSGDKQTRQEETTKGWITSFRRASIPRTLRKLVRASFATSTTTTIVTSPETTPITCHALETQRRGSVTDESVPQLQLGQPALAEKKAKFDPTRDISLAFLETVPTYHYQRHVASRPIQRQASPSPTLLCVVDEREAPVPRKRRRAKVVNPDIAYKGILKRSSDNAKSNAKSFRFNEQVLVGETWPKHDYDRKSSFSLQLTPHKAYQIKKELNDYKRDEMEVHEESHCYTHFFP